MPIVDRRLFLQNEDHLPLAGVVVEMFDLKTNKVISRSTSDQTGAASFNRVRSSTDNYWFRPLITRGSGRSGKMALNGAVHMNVEIEQPPPPPPEPPKPPPEIIQFEPQYIPKPVEDDPGAFLPLITPGRMCTPSITRLPANISSPAEITIQPDTLYFVMGTCSIASGFTPGFSVSAGSATITELQPVTLFDYPGGTTFDFRLGWWMVEGDGTIVSNTNNVDTYYCEVPNGVYEAHSDVVNEEFDKVSEASVPLPINAPAGQIVVFLGKAVTTNAGDDWVGWDAEGNQLFGDQGLPVTGFHGPSTGISFDLTDTSSPTSNHWLVIGVAMVISGPECTE